jgi:hypothetical protein
MSDKKLETICLEADEGSWELEIKRTYEHLKLEGRICYRKWKRNEGFDEFTEKSIMKLQGIQKENKMDAFAVDYF